MGQFKWLLFIKRKDNMKRKNKICLFKKPMTLLKWNYCIISYHHSGGPNTVQGLPPFRGDLKNIPLMKCLLKRI